MRWLAARPSTAPGVSNKDCSNGHAMTTGLLEGPLIAIGLIALITCIALISGWGRWLGLVTFTHMPIAVLL